MRQWVLGTWLAVILTACHPSRESLTAGHIGCPPNEVSTFSVDSSSGWNQSAETWTAECRGRRFICSEVTTSSFDLDGLFADWTDSVDSDVSCREELSPAEASPASRAPSAPRLASSPPPTGAGGFELGIARAPARERCKAAGHEWRVGKKGRATCSGTATPVGFPASVELAFCSDTACAVTLSHTPGSKWIQPFAALQASLTEKYGQASERRLRIPSMCRTTQQFDRCAEDGALHLDVSWRWATGQSVRLSLGKRSRPAGESAVWLTYVKAPRVRSLDASAL